MTPARRGALAMAVLAAAAGGLRLAAAVLRPAWHDEYFTAWAAALPLPDLLAALRLDSGPPLPYLLAKLVAVPGADPLAAARTVSVIAGTLAVMVAAVAARRSWGARAGWWCGALLAAHPLAVAWSSEGRAYALLLLAAALAWERLQALADGRPAAVGLALAIALGCWSHALGLVLAAAVAVGALGLGGLGRRRGLAAVAAGIASHLPWLPVALAQPAAASAWMGEAWAALPPSERLLAPLRLLPPLAPFGAHLDLPSAPSWACLAAAVASALLLAGARGALPAAALAALPPAGLLAAALAGATYLLPGRSEAVYLAAFAGLLAAGVTRARWRRAVGTLIVAAGTAMSGLALATWAAQPPRTEARLAAAIADALPGGGTVVVGGYWRLGVWRHLGRARGQYELVSVPEAAAAHPGWYDNRERSAAGELDALAAQLAAGDGEVAVVVAPGVATEAPLTALAHRLGLRQALAAPGVVLWVPAT